jgi:hypothetical protein
MEKSRKNNLQLRLSKQNEVLAERLMLKWQLDNGKTCNWTWFGNHLMQLGIKTANRALLGEMGRRDRTAHIAEKLLDEKGKS